jgi:hypothetical protein
MRWIFTTAAIALAVTAIATAGCQNSGSVNALSGGGQARIANPDKGGKTKQYYYPPELWNGFVTPPSPGPSPVDFEIVFQGNVTSDFPSPLEPGYGVYDPFCPPTQTCNNMTVSYNATSNTTTFEWSGSQLYENITGHGNEVHFGILNGPGGTRVKCLQWYTEWTFASAPPQPTPVLNVCNPKKVKTKAAAATPTVFATVFVETSFSPITSSNPATSGTWVDVPYTELKGSAQPKFEFTNNGSQTIYTANSGIVLNQSYPTDPDCIKDLYCKENIGNLELLNYAGMPPPGSSGSPFTTMKYPPPGKIPPSGR